MATGAISTDCETQLHVSFANFEGSMQKALFCAKQLIYIFLSEVKVIFSVKDFFFKFSSQL